MSSNSDAKPVAVGGDVMRRTNSHVLSNNSVHVTRGGDEYNRPAIRNFSLTQVPDSDPRWGLGREHPDYPE